jgi:succinate dehydrogenase / fumarate reductase, cytochrome b subunit
MASAQRPLSPHLQIYKWQLTMTLSILHRASGLVLAVGSVLLVWWLAAAASGTGAFATVQAFWGSWIGMLLLLGWSWSLFFHLCNGIRHLCWDGGWGYELRPTYISGWTVVGASALLTIIAWIAGLAIRGAV